MIHPSEALRLLHINWILLQNGLDEVILALHIFRPLRFILYLSPWYWMRHKKLPPYPVRIRHSLEELGPIFVKFGQILSTRRDLVPEQIGNELAKLQDAVPPFPGRQARRIIEQAYGRPIEEVLDEFDEVCGLENLLVVHANDSVGARGSRRDRHAHIGEGNVAMGAFSAVVNRGELAGRPLILETPKGEDEKGKAFDTINLGKLRKLERAGAGV